MMNKDDISSSSSRRRSDPNHHSTEMTAFHHPQNNQISFGNMTLITSSSPTSSSAAPRPPPSGTFNIIGKDGGGGAYDLGELDQALFLYLDAQHHSSSQHQKQNSASEMRAHPHTLNIFPSQPMHTTAAASSSKAANTTSGLIRPPDTASKNSSNPRRPESDVPSSSHQPPKLVKREGNRRGGTTASTSEQEGPKTPDPKTLRRLAQNIEAARKSRLRKKAYVQQLESSRIRLTQLEQEIQRARSQGFYVGGNALIPGDHQAPPALAMGAGINSVPVPEAALFDMEYGRWLEEHHRVTVELRNAVQEELPENELGNLVETCLAHYDQLTCLKNMIAKSDAFHLMSGVWRTPSERCFMWIGGFRPSHLIKVMMREIEPPLTEQQVAGICGLQQTTQEAEDALSQGMEALNQSLSETIVSESLSMPPNMNTYMAQMALAINKLSTLEAFLTQGDNLRQQTFHRVRQILSTRQIARCILALAEYLHRLRALSSLWLGRPRPHPHPHLE